MLACPLRTKEPIFKSSLFRCSWLLKGASFWRLDAQKNTEVPSGAFFSFKGKDIDRGDSHETRGDS